MNREAEDRRAEFRVSSIKMKSHRVDLFVQFRSNDPNLLSLSLSLFRFSRVIAITRPRS